MKLPSKASVFAFLWERVGTSNTMHKGKNHLIKPEKDSVFSVLLNQQRRILPFENRKKMTQPPPLRKTAPIGIGAAFNLIPNVACHLHYGSRPSAVK
jgi:hypothetical protein